MKCFWCKQLLQDKAYEYDGREFCGKGCAHEFSTRAGWLTVSTNAPVPERGGQLQLALQGALSVPCKS